MGSSGGAYNELGEGHRPMGVDLVEGLLVVLLRERGSENTKERERVRFEIESCKEHSKYGHYAVGLTML